jgi:hypothetical protein
MKREDVESLKLGETESFDSAGRPTRLPVIGLPSYPQAEIVGGGQSGYQYRLTRDGDVNRYTQNQFSRTPEAALEALKGLLNWEPARCGGAENAYPAKCWPYRWHKTRGLVFQR